MLWGLAFVATRIGLNELSPPQLAVARFAIAAAPVLVVAVGTLPDGPRAIADVHALSWHGFAAAVYLGAVATTLAYAIWGALLRRYPTALIAPFALLVPFVAAASSALVFGERFGGLRLAGIALVLCGPAVIVLPVREANA